MRYLNAMPSPRHFMTALAGCLLLLAMTSQASAQNINDLVSQGNLGMGAGGTFNYTTSSNEQIENTVATGQVTNSNLFMLIAPEFGYFMSDRLQLAINIGFLLRNIQRDKDSSNAERNYLFTGGVKYHVPFTERFSFIPGLGAGFYIGSSSRPVQTTIQNMPTIVDESTSTWGFDMNGQLGFGYLVGDRTELTAGLQFHYLYGFENIPSVAESLSISTFNTGLNFGLFYYF